MTVDTLPWLVARTGGFVAYGLLTISVAYGLLLGMGWKNPRWTRFVTNEVHRFITLLSLVFTAVHGLAIALDSFVGIGLVGVLVPFASSYRPLWLALGIVGGYLLLAVHFSERVRARIGYAWWRRFHTLAFVGFVLALVHGIASGSDTRSVFGMAIYGGSIALVGGLLAFRLFPAPPKPAMPVGAVLSIATGAAVFAFAILGPLAPGWSVRAGGELPAAVAAANAAALVTTTGGGGLETGPAAPSDPPTPEPTLTAGGALGGLPLDAALAFEGRLMRPRFERDDAGRIGPATFLRGRLADGTAVFVVQLVPTEAAIVGVLRVETGDGSTCEGPVTALTDGGLEAACESTAGTMAGTTWKVTVNVSGGREELRGTLTFTPWTGGAPQAAPLGPVPSGEEEEFEDHDADHHEADDHDGDHDGDGGSHESGGSGESGESEG